MNETIQEAPAVSSPAGDDKIVETNEEVQNPEAVLEKNRQLVAEKRQALEREKKAREELDSLKAKLEELETAGADQDPKAALGALKKKLETVEMQKRELNKNYAVSVARKALESEALKAGCNNLDLLMKAVDLRDVFVDAQTFEPDQTSVQALIDEAKKNYSILFNQRPNVQDVNLRHHSTSKSVDLKSKSTDELMNIAKSLGKM
jgi:hypothetical protein